MGSDFGLQVIKGVMVGGACGCEHRCKWKETQRSGGVPQKGRFDFLLYRTGGAREIRLSCLGVTRAEALLTNID